jgi:CRP-like cAMP-binding protein
VKFSVVNGSGKEAVVAMFGPNDFCGEGCMAGQSVRMGTATAITPTTLLVIDKNELLRVLHAEHELSDYFITYMLAHNIRVEEDLIDQLFNSSEKRSRVRFYYLRATENKNSRSASWRRSRRRRSRKWWAPRAHALISS